MLADALPFGQTFEMQDLAVVGLLIVLEGVLSIDNALVLGLLAKRLPKEQQSRALTYGLVGAFVFRLLAIGTAGLLLKWRIVKLLGGGYLVYIAVRHLFFESQEQVTDTVKVDEAGNPILVDAATGEEIPESEAEIEIEERVPVSLGATSAGQTAARTFWGTVLVIELTDIAFAVDSILAAIALVGSSPADQAEGAVHPKLWIVLAGGMLGVILMRFAAVVFIKLLERFPRFEEAAYLLIIVIGGKLLIDYFFNSPEHPHVVDFHDWGHPAFWVFWGLMLSAFCVGFIPRRPVEVDASASRATLEE